MGIQIVGKVAQAAKASGIVQKVFLGSGKSAGPVTMGQRLWGFAKVNLGIQAASTAGNLLFRSFQASSGSKILSGLKAYGTAARGVALKAAPKAGNATSTEGGKLLFKNPSDALNIRHKIRSLHGDSSHDLHQAIVKHLQEKAL